MKRSKFNSNCCVCKKPAMAPKGNFNAQRVTLCKRAKCRRLRKTKLQKERRRQKELELFEEIQDTVRAHRTGKRSL